MTDITNDLIETLGCSTEKVEGLPGKFYGASFFEEERNRLFPRLWCAVGVASEIAHSGDAVPVDLAGWPVVLVRDHSGEVRAFHNICRHRGMSLLQEKVNGLEAFSCPWHAWRYGLDGQLINTPRVGGETTHTQDGLDSSVLGLVPIRVAQWQDMIFVNLDGKAPALSEHIKPLDTLFSNYDLGALRWAYQWRLSYPGNWKVSIEGAIEDYHLPVGHPQIVRGARRWNSKLYSSPLCFYANSVAREFENEQSEGLMSNIATGLTSPLSKVPLHTPVSGPRRTYFMSVFPTGMLQVHGDNAVQGLILPNGSGETTFVFNHYFVGDDAHDPELSSYREQIIAEWKLVFEQDIPFVDSVHRNYQVRDQLGISTRFSAYWEENIHRFQRDIAEFMRVEQ